MKNIKNGNWLTLVDARKDVHEWEWGSAAKKIIVERQWWTRIPDCFPKNSGIDESTVQHFQPHRTIYRLTNEETEQIIIHVHKKRGTLRGSKKFVSWLPPRVKFQQSASDSKRQNTTSSQKSRINPQQQKKTNKFQSTIENLKKPTFTFSSNKYLSDDVTSYLVEQTS